MVDVGEEDAVTIACVDDIRVFVVYLFDGLEDGVGFVVFGDMGVIDSELGYWLVEAQRSLFTGVDMELYASKVGLVVVNCPLGILEDELMWWMIGDLCVAEDAFSMEVTCGETKVDIVEVVAVKATPCVDGGGKLPEVV